MIHNHVKVTGKCQWPDCTKDATTFASNIGEIWPEYEKIAAKKLAEGTFGFYCDEHAHLMADERSPEYHVHCPYCACRFGVN